jgi:hypothetical protein
MDLTQTSLADLARACQRETSRFQRGEPSDDQYCRELFRRAVCEREQMAWDAIVTQYRGIVLAWIRQHPASAAAQEDDEFWVNRAFERFWMALGPERFALFPDLRSLLKYLKLCVHSVLLDGVRARHATRLEPLEQAPAERTAEGADIEALAVGRLAGGELWQAIEAALPDESERLLIYLSYALDLKPRQIQERHPALYPTVADVYRIKRNVLDRLRRSDELRRLRAAG